MNFKLNFLGAAQNVTGSRHLLEANGTKVLIDCGMYQERQLRDRNWEKFAVEPSEIDAVILTHGHLDHCGHLPKLVKEGFNGKIYCTEATADIAKIILLDSAKIQMEDAEKKRKRHQKEGRVGPHPVKPLYTIEDAESCFPLFEPYPYREVIPLGNGIEATLYDAGHVLGSSIIRAKIRKNGEERIILFSGDIGRPDRPIVCDPTVFDTADYVLIESTYGNRVHQEELDSKEKIGKIVRETIERKGNVIVPSFALERSQELLYFINELRLENKIPFFKIFLDSPMASRITKVFKKHPELYDKEMRKHVRLNHSPFEIEGLSMAGSSDESKAINYITEPIMIIAGSGMCTGGRIKHHLINNITDEKNTIMFVGYQAVGTLGRLIVDGASEVRILGERWHVNANIERVHGFSAHADRNELLAWLKNLKESPRKVFVIHGESESAISFGDYVRQQTGWDVEVPEYGDEVIMD